MASSTRVVLVVLLSLAALLVVASAIDNAGLSAHLSSADKKTLAQRILSTQGSDGLFGKTMRSAYHAVNALQFLGESVPNKNKLCQSVKTAIESAQDVAVLDDAVRLSETLSCGVKLPNAAVSLLQTAIEEAPSVSAVSHAASVVLRLDGTERLSTLSKADLSNVLAQIAEFFNDELSIEDSGRAYEVAAQLAPLTDDSMHLDLVLESVSSVLQRYEEISDTAVAFFDKGDSGTAYLATASLLRGLTALAAVRDDLELPEDLASSVAEYIVNLPLPTNVVDIDSLLSITNEISGDRLASPVALVLKQRSISTGSSKSDIEIEISDIWGSPIDGINAFLVRANKIGSTSALLSNQPLRASTTSAQNTVFLLSLLSSKPEAGLYELEFSVRSSNNQFAAISSTKRIVQVTIPVSLSDLEVSFIDAVDNEVIQKQSLNDAKKKFDVGTEASYLNKIRFSFSVRSSSGTSKAVNVQQAFVSFTNVETKQQAVFPATFNGKGYSLELNLREQAARFKSHSGHYTVQLFIADSFVENPIIRELGDAKLLFLGSSNTEKRNVYEHKPDIEHKFRVPEKRPAESFSLGFTLLVLAPVGLLFIGILSVGFNLRNIPTSPIGLVASIGFLASIGAAIALYAEFWLSLNMFDTLQYLGVIALVGSVCGKFALRSRQEKRLKPKSE